MYTAIFHENNTFGEKGKIIWHEYLIHVVQFGEEDQQQSKLDFIKCGFEAEVKICGANLLSQHY